MTTIATLCARGGSVGVPRKNIKPLLGKPLIQYSIEQAKACSIIDNIYVSTDDPEIAEIATQNGITVPFLRPAHLAQDHISKLDVIQHLVAHIEQQGITVSTIIDLDITAPLRTTDDIVQCYNMLTPEVDLVVSGYLSTKNPYFNLVERKENGDIALSKKTDRYFPSRQLAPPVFALNGSIYIWHRHTLTLGLWGCKTIKIYEMPLERSIDIDTPIDWKLAEILMTEKNKSV